MSNNYEAAGGEPEVRDTDISFDCPHCGMNHVVDFRAAGLQVQCKDCGKDILVPIPAGMELGDLDLDPGEILQQLFASRRNYQKAELEIQELKSRLIKIQEAIGVVQSAVTEEGVAVQHALAGVQTVVDEQGLAIQQALGAIQNVIQEGLAV